MRPLQNGNLRLLTSYMETQVPRGSYPVKGTETAWPFMPSPGRHIASLLLCSICQSNYTNLYRFKGRTSLSTRRGPQNVWPYLKPPHYHYHLEQPQAAGTWFTQMAGLASVEARADDGCDGCDGRGKRNVDAEVSRLVHLPGEGEGRALLTENHFAVKWEARLTAESEMWGRCFGVLRRFKIALSERERELLQKYSKTMRQLLRPN